MVNISELAKSVGLSRSTLLYYEKIGLLRAQRQHNGYRLYGDADRQRLILLQQLQAGGLSLKECQACLDGKIDRDLLRKRFEALRSELENKNRSLSLLAALLGEGSLKEWHEYIEQQAPDLHRQWLITQGFSSDEASRVALLSRDMNDHDRYMAAFMEIFSELDYWGPGSRQITEQTLASLPIRPRSILEVGCGNGVATLVLAKQSSARVTALDTDEGALERLRARATAANVADRVDTLCLDMAKLPELKASFDVIWAEGSAYIVGVERALKDWRPLLEPGGVLVFSDMVWRTTQPDAEVQAFWASEYPAMTTVAKRLKQAQRAGYRVLSHVDMGQSVLDAYYLPLEARLQEMRTQLAGHRVLDDLRRELGAYRQSEGQFGYEMFVLVRN
jgi:DNA-binding transcriptional MerR regulator/predicted O-methyltransferase YrrM